jgi:hypothetical protein
VLRIVCYAPSRVDQHCRPSGQRIGRLLMDPGGAAGQPHRFNQQDTLRHNPELDVR